ncbi:hypothetical protein QJS04_geneDACA013582 [Acorus gramineus]|uniref:RBR-type E3 ubiquitin transferase n=1 Tax=Acorus gramineus TaxID=55184 RepID=A0AAV9AGS2_ACOGR|nr:hypothetical protein QJS04_geneDACA013582 [Acorus gramineus]
MEECVDEFYLSALSDHDQPFPISDQTYAEELHLQEVLMSCILSSLPNHQTLPPPKYPTGEVGESSGSHVCMEEKPSEDMFKNINTPSCAAHSFCHDMSHVFKDCSALPIDSSPSVEPGDSSKSSLCGICFEPKSHDEIFLTKACEHVFCMDCMGSYVASRIQDNATDVLCPDPNCDERLKMENCHPILAKEVFDRWGDALCESVILGSAKFYCPFKDCSALLLDEGVVFEESECPHCHRLFCAKCKVPWHPGIGCEEYQRLGVDERGREDIMLKTLAKECRWQRCVKCGFYVEKTQGCTYMLCRCGYGFCYGCGDQLMAHYCVKCNL